ncbi:bacillithiol system redox-active protein YtxJ [Balneola sp. MJW-20]|uniref:bacillithiol system redox-active protein YtxJ n=1 Tax=Gracilimonas aurantiaca TaxID=3234185 RepID=UPI0034662F81
MGILNSLSKLFPESTGSDTGFWEALPDPETVESFLDDTGGTMVIFKNSPYCGTSMFAKNSLDALDPEKWTGIRFFMIDVIKERQISDRISKLFGVRHESPQVLVIHNGSVYWHASHARVNAEQLRNTLRSI